MTKCNVLGVSRMDETTDCPFIIFQLIVLVLQLVVVLVQSHCSYHGPLRLQSTAVFRIKALKTYCTLLAQHQMADNVSS